MPEMPGRPDEHVLGDRAVDAFRSLLPTRWIYRPKTPDYGIDGEVELVSCQEQLTGRLFYVQSKGTETDSLDDALRVRLKVSTANYYRALDLPVLIVRYHAPTNRVYVKWFDSVSPSVPQAGKDTFTLKLSQEDEFNPDRSAKIAQELESIRLIKLTRLVLPVSVSLSSRPSHTEWASTAEITSAARALVNRQVLIFNPDALINVEIGPADTDVRLGAAYKFSFKTPTLLDNKSPKTSAANIIIAIGLALGRVGQNHAAAVLICASALDGNVLNSFLHGIEAAFYLAADDRNAEALDIARSVIRSPDALEMAQLMAAVPLLAHSMPRSSTSHTQLLREIVVEAERQPDNAFRATAHYNLANHLRSTERRESLRHYHLAVLCDPQYGERSYYWHEIGALLFASKRFRAAITCYERAIARGDAECRPLLADALLWAGEYDRSCAEFDDYLRSVAYPPSEWALKGMFVRLVRDKVGSGTQRRDRMLAMQLAAPRTTVFDESQFMEALRADGLCGLAWFNQAASEVRAQNYENSAICFMAAALCQPNDFQAWCSAIGSAINCHRMDLLGHIISAAYRANGEPFSEALFEYFRQQPATSPIQKTKIIELLGEFLATVPTSGKQRTFRIFPAGGAPLKP
jgi:tetratricopeptide (TPR) repeat protein